MRKAQTMTVAEYNALAMSDALKMLQEARRERREKTADPDTERPENVRFTRQMDIFDFLK